MLEQLTHKIEFRTGYDCIKFECNWDKESCKPNTGGSHGKHGLEMKFITKGPKGAVVFKLYTGWLPQYCELSDIGSRYVDTWSSSMMPMPADLGYHAKEPQYEGQSICRQECEYCDGQPCYYDGSGLNASDAMYALVNGGDTALWEFLDSYYACVFENAPYLQPAEYHKPLRKE